MFSKIRSTVRTVTINSLGAELHSLVSNNSGDEFMWKGDPAVWGGRAPILFPIVGGLKGNKMSVAGQTYSMEKHGFARHEEFTCLEQSDNRITFSLVANEKLLKIYPWNFELVVIFKIVADILTITYRVINTDSQILLFSIGSHPAFRLPLEHSTIEDYAIEFSESETLDVYRVIEDVLATEPAPFLINERLICLSRRIFDNDALVFKNVRSRKITLTHRTHGERVIVDTGGAPDLGIWAKPGAPYVCIEPWWGHADFSDATPEFSEKAGIQRLSPGELFETSISITTMETTVF